MRRLGAILAVGMALALGACAFDTVIVPRRTPLVQVHAILNTARTIQLIIVERVVADQTISTNDAGGAVAIPGATVTLTIPGGRVLTAAERVDTIESAEPGLPGTTDERSRRYEVNTDFPNRLVPGGDYQLRVVTPDGEVVTGSTRIPSQSPVGATNRTFNRERDTLALTWPAVSGAAAYWVQANGPNASYNQFLDEAHVRLGGDLKSLGFDEDHTGVFTPAFQTHVIVAAVDRNCYDYFRSASDPFTGLGRINRLEGGYGVFGSSTTVAFVHTDVTINITDPKIEGRWQLRTAGGSAGSRASEFRLFADREHPATDTTVTLLVGSYMTINSTTNRQPVIGSRDGIGVEIGLFTGSAREPDDRLIGVVRGDTLRGSYLSDGLSVLFVRVP